MLEIVAVHVPNQVEQPVIDQLWSLIPADRQKQLGKYRFKMDMLRSLVGEAFVRTWYGRLLNISTIDINIQKNIYGKPQLVGYNSAYFNISPAENWVVIAFDQYPVGIDIEFMTQIDPSLAKCFFTDKEYRYIFNGNDSKQQERFFEIWTYKESYLKAIGTGLTTPLNSFQIEPSSTITAYSRPIYSTNSDHSWYLQQYDISSKYKFAVCAAHSKFPENPTKYELNQYVIDFPT